MLERCWNNVGTMLERCWNDVGNDVGTMLERCSTSRFAEIGQPVELHPGKEIGTPSLKAVGEKSFSFLEEKKKN